MLRDHPDGAASTRPQPTLGDLPALVEECRAAGVRVNAEYRVADLGSAPTVTGRTAYRVVQEGLTNARKHAPGQPVRIRMHGDRHEGITFTATNPQEPARTAEPEGGFGLIGLQERVQLLEGRLHVASTAGAFTVTAWLPWQN